MRTHNGRQRLWQGVLFLSTLLMSLEGYATPKVLHQHLRRELLGSVASRKWKATENCADQIQRAPASVMYVNWWGTRNEPHFPGNEMPQMLQTMAATLDQAVESWIVHFPKYYRDRLRGIYSSDRYRVYYDKVDEEVKISAVGLDWHTHHASPRPLLYINPDVDDTVLVKRLLRVYELLRYGLRIPEDPVASHTEMHESDIAKIHRQARDGFYATVFQKLLIEKIPSELLDYDLRVNMLPGQAQSVLVTEFQFYRQTTLASLLETGLTKSFSEDDRSLAQGWIAVASHPK